MLISGFLFMGLVHVVLSINCIFADTVDDDVGMNVTGSIVSVCMSDYQCLIAGKVLSGILQTKSLGLFAGKSTFCYICRIETDDVMMAFDISSFLIFVKKLVSPFALFVKRHRITV